MRPTGRLSAFLAAAVIATLLAACASGTAGPISDKTSLATSGLTSTQPQVPSTPSATPPAESSLTCGDYIDGNAPVAQLHLRVILGVVALPVSPGYGALQTALTGESGALRLFAKTGLVVRPGATFELIVPAPFTNRLSIGWGNPGTPSHRVVISNCPNPGGGWLAYAGGYWIDHPACVPMIVRAGSRQQQVHIGVGTACPGQRPPQGPSQS